MDRIGLYIDNGSEVQYRELTYQGGEWMPRLKRSDFGDGTLTMSAHYPAVADPEAIDPAASLFSCRWTKAARHCRLPICCSHV
ncbi:hypothetical protein [Millionella massiliensis]|uniref:hypothetical protein n=1 Tax=Millionella massiliensis TaxID=1871023 RepID=UPI0023A8F343|nr:hypothetical protein [Millionella massiliensis]